MSQYIEPVKSALVLFPFVALVLTLPYMLFQYRRYGAVLLLRTAIVYSFVLYLMCAYFLVILPLPDVETVSSLTSARVQLIPFREVADLLHNAGVDPCRPATWYRLVWNRDFFQIVANVAMFTPLGIYLRYYFGCSLKKTLLFSLLLSLFFELTQLTGLYGYYPRPYRLADVDDLITNTCGGLLGYALAPLAMRLLPSREQMDARAYRKGEQVSVTRRCFAALVDFAVMLVALAALMWRLPSVMPSGEDPVAMAAWLFGCYAVGIVGYFVLGTWLGGGRTVGKVLLHLRLTDLRSGGRPRLWQCAVRYGVLYLVVMPTPAFLLLAITLGTEDGEIGVWLVLACIGLLMIYILFWLLLAVHVVTHDNQLLHGKLSMTHNVSTLRHRYFARWHGARHAHDTPIQ